MLVQTTATQASGSSVVGAIQNAATATGTSFQYLLATAQVESGLNPKAAASGSSARGLYQFIDQTWLATMKDSGASLGYRRYADAITRTSSGRYQVSDPAMRKEIMALRNDPAANASMAGAFTQKNAAKLSARIGRTPSNGELYMAHFLGAAGAGRLISAASNAPSARAADTFPSAARANRSIFFDRQGNARTNAEVYGVLAGRFETALTTAKLRPPADIGAVRAAPQVAAATTAVIGATQTSVVSTPAAASAAMSSPPTAMGYAADRSVAPVQSLFSDRSQPVSRVIQELWTSRPAVAAALTGQTASAVTPSGQAGTPLDLFSNGSTDARRLFGARS